MKFHYTFKTLPPELSRIPEVDLVGLSKEDEERLQRFRDGFIQRVEFNRPLKEAADIAGCTSSELIRVFNRFMTVNDDGTVANWANVVKNARVKTYTRSDESAANATSRSAMGMFSRLLNAVEGAREALIDLIVQRIGPDGRMISRKVKARIAEGFSLWRAEHVLDEPAGGYGESLSSSSVYRFIDEYLNGHVDEYDIWFGKNSKKQLKVGTGYAAFRLATMPFDKVMIDAHRVDVIGTIKITTPHGPKLVPISRIWLVVMLDGVSKAVLGYSVSFEEQVSAETVERAIICSQTPWEPRKLSPGLRYAEGACLPAGNIKGLDAIPLCMLCMDNFSSHYATLIQATARQALGFHSMFGGLGAWWTNAALERFFGVLEQYGIHRLSSTTGSGTNDPLRPEHPGKRAIENAVAWTYIVDLLEVLLTELNTLRGSGRSDMSPLEIIRNHLMDPDTQMVPNFSVPASAFRPRLGYEVRKRSVSGRREAGVIKFPYIEIDGRYFTNDLLKPKFDLVGTEIWVHTRRADFYVEAYFHDGSPVGQLLRCGGEDDVPSSQALVKQLRKGRHRSKVPDSKLREARKEGLAAQAAKDVTKRPGMVSQAATQLANIELTEMHATHVRQSTPAPTLGNSRVREPVTKKSPSRPALDLSQIAAFGGLRSRR